MVELHDERDAVRVAARHRAEHAERRRDGVAAAFDRELDDVRRVEVASGSARTTRRRSARCPGRREGSRRSRCRRGGRASNIACEVAQHLRRAVASRPRRGRRSRGRAASDRRGGCPSTRVPASCRRRRRASPEYPPRALSVRESWRRARREAETVPSIRGRDRCAAGGAGDHTARAVPAGRQLHLVLADR